MECAEKLDRMRPGTLAAASRSANTLQTEQERERERTLGERMIRIHIRLFFLPSRIPGITPEAIVVLLRYLKKETDVEKASVEGI